MWNILPGNASHISYPLEKGSCYSTTGFIIIRNYWIVIGCNNYLLVLFPGKYASSHDF